MALTINLGEGCLYLVKESAIKKTDFVLNGLEARHWSPIRAALPGNFGKFLNIPPPRNPLQAIARVCNSTSRGHKRGLLSALGYRNIMNVAKFIGSPEVEDGFTSKARAYVFSCLTDEPLFLLLSLALGST